MGNEFAEQAFPRSMSVLSHLDQYIEYAMAFRESGNFASWLRGVAEYNQFLRELEAFDAAMSAKPFDEYASAEMTNGFRGQTREMYRNLCDMLMRTESEQQEVRTRLS